MAMNIEAGRESLARALGFGCVAAMESGGWFGRLNEHSRLFETAVLADDEVAMRASFAALDCVQDDDPALTVARAMAAPLFLAGVCAAQIAPSLDCPSEIQTLWAFADAHHKALGFTSAPDAFDAIVPHADELTLDAWSEQVLRVRGFDVRVSVRAFSHMPYGAHIQIESLDRSALPFTETGFKSLFLTFKELAQWPSVLAFITDLFPVSDAERAGQGALFS